MDKTINEKIYVTIIAQFDKYGNIKPLELIWEEGRKFAITQIHNVCRAASTKAGGTGYRYTVTIEGQKRNIWLEDIVFKKTIGARWFVEKK